MSTSNETPSSITDPAHAPASGRPARSASQVGLAAVALLVIGLLVGSWWLVRPPAGDGVARFEVRTGSSVTAIGRELEHAGLVRFRVAFVGIVRMLGAERELRAGTYELPRGVVPWALVRILRAGVIELHQVTIPEGLTLWETAGLLGREAAVDSSAFMRLATDPAVATDLSVPSSNLEGYLFPNTYDIPLEKPANEIIPPLVERTLSILDEGLRRYPQTELEPAEIIILASIVEAEARVAAEQPRIAAVYLNRLRGGWRLEADPTVLYALGERRRVLYKDLEVDSPWNTYRVAGLPPTPICSPGRGAILAVFEPEPDCDDFYFVARSDGSHHFSKTLAEHEQATHRIRLEQRRARSKR